MSEVTDRIRAYKQTGEGWPELRDWLVAHKYGPAARYNDPQPSPLEERDWDHPFVDGSFDEVVRAHSRGELTHDEFDQIMARMPLKTPSP